jgi:2-dehydropantoate 2-reductase
MTNNKLSVLCFGAGAIGSYVGASLIANGHHVVFLDRPETVKKLKNNGIQLDLINGEKIDLKNPVLTSDLDSILNEVKFDFSIIAVKSYDTDELLSQWSGLEKKIPPVLCLQNGIENEFKIGKIIGHENVIPGTVTTAIGKKENGTIVVEKLRGIGIFSNHVLSKLIISEMSKAGLNAHQYSNPNSMKWSKLLTNLTANATSAILSMTPGEILSDNSLFKIEIEQLRETLSVMRSLNIPVCNLPGTPVKLFAFLVKFVPRFLSKVILSKAMASGRGTKMPSFYIDLMSGRKKSEVDYLNGAVVRFGEKNKILTPVNVLLTETLVAITEGGLPHAGFINNPAKLIQLIYE